MLAPRHVRPRDLWRKRKVQSRDMSVRPFLNHSIEALETQFQERRTDGPFLEALASELALRKTDRARRLLQSVEAVQRTVRTVSATGTDPVPIGGNVIEATFPGAKTAGRDHVRVVVQSDAPHAKQKAAEEPKTDPETERLSNIYDVLRNRLLDLSFRNPMLNYKPMARSKRHLQIIDEWPEDVHQRLVSHELSLDLAALPEPPDVPEDEQTEEFESELAYLKTTDLEYQVALTALESDGRDDEFEIAKLERSLRDRLRKRLGMAPRPSRKDFDLKEHAKANGINPNPELTAPKVTKGQKRTHLQTLLLPESLETRLDGIADIARLAAQEMGLSTLFLAFGFLELYQSDSSEKANFAPLLLLPVTLESRVVTGRTIYSIKATSEAPSPNITLAKYLDEEWQRTLPNFEPDPAAKNPIEAYFDEVAKAIDKLPRWKVRRFLTLGHFTFGRLAMYEDLNPAHWEGATLDGLVGNILRGTETDPGDAREPHSGIPEDYEIDTPEVEALAPLLVHDSDGSQHSAIVDVMKRENLVIEGPPGTGKSQTITNIIANALARDGTTTVLFLSEKLAALNVVKRRLDAAGLGEFCLELHSEKSSPSMVVASLAERLGIGTRTKASSILNSALYASARKEIGDYVADLHAPDQNGDAAFDLFWKTIEADRVHADLPMAVRQTELPTAITGQSDHEIGALLNELALFGTLTEEFSEEHGKLPTESPWAALSLTAPRGVAADVITALRAAAEAVSNADDVLRECEQNGFAAENIKALEHLHALPEAPDLERIELLTGFDPSSIQEVAQHARSLRQVEHRLDADPLDGEVDDEALEDVTRLAQCLWSRDLYELSPARIFEEAENTVEMCELVLSLIEQTRPIRDLLGLTDDEPLDILPTACAAAVAASAVTADLRGWLCWEPAGDRGDYRKVQKRWDTITTAEADWQDKLRGYGPESRPDPAHLLIAADALDTKYVFLKPWRINAQREARKLAASLGLSSTASETLRALAAHVTKVGAFESDQSAAKTIGVLWRGLRTDFRAMDLALRAKNLLVDRFADKPHGDRLVAKLFELPKDALDELGNARAVALANRDYPAGFALPASFTFTQARMKLANDQRLAQLVLAGDFEDRLGTADAPLRALDVRAKLVQERDAIVDRLGLNKAAQTVLDMVDQPTDAEEVVKLADWIEAVSAASLPTVAASQLLTPSGEENRQRLCELAHRTSTKLTAERDALDTLRAAYGCDLEGTERSKLVEALGTALACSAELPDMLGLMEVRRDLIRAGLGDFLRIADAQNLPPRQYSSAVAYLCLRRRAERRRAETPILRDATGSKLNARRVTFAEQDKLKIEHDRAHARATVIQRNGLAGEKLNGRKNWTEMALVHNEIPKGRAFVSVRRLLRQAPASVRALKPCFMMSPMSVAKFLPRDMKFDLVVIDEASQMRPEDALGALLRAQQIVVVGDPKQLPPTDFFSRTVDSTSLDDDEADDDLNDESILEACSKTFDKVRHLKWHYRSRCESLIAFSNEQFYDRKLITFPMAAPGSFSVDLVHVAGTYQAQQNTAEAQRICEEAIGLMEKLADLPDSEFGTIGIVAVNSKQRELIYEEFRRLSSGNASVKTFIERSEGLGEPFIVKNLENVQGDERDYILISLTYGPAPGKKVVDQRFGPINRSQGHRRLNVLFSRARRRIGLFTSMHSTDIRPGETSKRGVHILKAYLEYAERGETVAGSLTGKPFDSPFEREVAERLKAHGYDVDIQVGASKFRIDLGIKHPRNSSVYLAGVECDGAAYHSSRSARDRDRLREEVLRGLGWNIVRVWSTDWFADPERATNRLVEQLRTLEQRPLKDETKVMFGRREARPVPEPDIGTVDTPQVRDPDNGVPQIAAPSAPPPIAPVRSSLTETGALTVSEARQALEDFRRTVIEVEHPEAEPHRCILREAMIETFLATRVADRDEWFKRVPRYLREGTDPAQSRKYLDPILSIVERIR